VNNKGQRMSLEDNVEYEEIEGDFYHRQTVSRNPLRRWFHLNRYRISNSLVKSKYKKGQKIADLGCGSCDWNVDGLNVVGIDANERLLQRASEGGRVSEYKVVDAGDTGFADESFEIVTAFEFLEHLHDYHRVVGEAHRILKKGGYFIISVPYDTAVSMWRPLFFLHVILQGYILGKTYYRARCGHVNHFSPESLRNVLTGHGFTVEYMFDMRRFTIFACARKEGAYDTAEPYGDTTIILPTLNEERNIAGLLDGVISRYRDCSIIVADDGSKDRTKEVVLAKGYRNLEFFDRGGEAVHGLTISVLDAIERVKTPYFVVMDADGQHPYEKVEDVVNMLRLGGGLVIASRAEVERNWPFFRKAASYIGTSFGKTSLLLRGKKYLSYDVLGGFFGCDVTSWRQTASSSDAKMRFRARGYKVLFDFLKLAPNSLRIEEVYYRFATRRAEVSKLNLKVYVEFLKSCLMR
jgi:2-polyprenyl-3-methyl-5-hydroxy-6-metoxy-1,4-benzoquinol methylase